MWTACQRRCKSVASISVPSVILLLLCAAQIARGCEARWAVMGFRGAQSSDVTHESVSSYSCQVHAIHVMESVKFFFSMTTTMSSFHVKFAHYISVHTDFRFNFNNIFIQIIVYLRLTHFPCTTPGNKNGKAAGAGTIQTLRRLLTIYEWRIQNVLVGTRRHPPHLLLLSNRYDNRLPV